MHWPVLPGISLFLWASQALALCTWLEQSGKRLPVNPDLPTVVLVDVASSGVDLLPVFRKEGWNVVHATSGVDPNWVAHSSKDLVFDGETLAFDPGKKLKQAAFNEVSRLKPRLVIAASVPGVELADALAAKLTPEFANDPRLARARHDKGEAYRVLRSKGLATPLGGTTKSEAQALAIAQEIFDRGDGLVVVKPPRSFGTKDYHRCRTLDEVRRAFRAIFNRVDGHNRLQTEVVVTDYIDGPEYALQFSSTIDPATGKVVHVLTDVIAYFRDGEDGARYDYDNIIPLLDPSRPIVAYAKQVLDELGVRFGPSHLEIKISSRRGPVIIDPNIGRSCGAKLPRAVKRVSGYSQIEGTFDSYMNPQRLLERQRGYVLNSNASMIFVRAIPKEGGVFFQDPIKALIQEYGPEIIIDHGFDFGDGSRVVQTVDSPTTLGYVTVVHPDPKIIQEIRTRIRQAEHSGLVVH